MDSFEPHPLPRIQRLSENLINQINAGEIVERPSNVVKELIENSLDAGARTIEIALINGGLEEILIKDDGSGIPSEDLALAVERHTTSKIQSAGDLAAIESFGFRGEALASIASVSSLRIRSAIASACGGSEINIEFGVAGDLVPAAHSKGTSVWVRNLFVRTPARKKYLRSVQTELAYISRAIKELALAHPSVAFQLYHQGELLHSYPVNELKERFWSCLKKDWQPLEIFESAPGLELAAYLSPPESSDERSELYLFINRRTVRNKTFIAAVRNAYADVLGKGVEPTGAVYLSIQFDWVDVNAHPQKLEVRCLNQEKLYRWLYLSISKRLNVLVGSSGIGLKGRRSDFKPDWVGKLADRYLVFLGSDGIEVVDSRQTSNDGRESRYRVKLNDLEKFFNP